MEVHLASASTSPVLLRKHALHPGSQSAGKILHVFKTQLVRVSFPSAPGALRPPQPALFWNQSCGRMGRSAPSQPLCWSCGSPRLPLTSILAPTLLSSTILPPIYGLHFPVHVTAFLGSPTLISLHFHQNACSKMTVSPFSENPLRDQHCALTGEDTACDASTPHGQWFESWLLYSPTTSVWPGPGLCSIWEANQ